MARETLDAVRQAELNALKLEREAELKKDEIIQKAKEDAKILISSRTQEVKQQASQKLKVAEEQGQRFMEEAVNKATQEIQMLKEIVQGKKQTAISHVLKEVI